MKRLSKSLAIAVGAALGLALAASPAMAEQANKKPIKFATALDFTKVYTFVSNYYSQGQQDYIKLVNQEGGIDGHPVKLMISDTGNEPERGIEAYHKARDNGAVLVDFLSTPVSKAMISRVDRDHIVMITALHGNAAASDGQVFPYVFPMMATYWSQAAQLIHYMQKHEGGLKGKKIAHVYIDSPFGREPVPVLKALSKKLGFQLKTFAYPSPGNEQSSTWSAVRRYHPDFVTIWGAGNGQVVSIKDAIRNGIKPSQIYSVVWLAKADTEKVGAKVAKGVRKFAATKIGTSTPVLKKIVKNVIDKGEGSGKKKYVGGTYYNIGVATMVIAVQAARNAMKKYGAPLTGEKLRKGFQQIDDYDADGLIPPVTITPKDHQGGGFGRVAEWEGDKWKALNDWNAAYQDVVWDQIRKEAKEYKENEK
jgi:branched-chain amino acid transport system substrate-binding protein